MTGERPILIAGPTASGKSRLALRLAVRHGGLVINADAMQVYRELRILTARPTPEDEAEAPHALYGHVPAREAYSVGRWIEDVRGALARAEREGLRPIIVGGTGLYFKALLEGLSEIPPIPPDIRDRWRAEAAAVGAADLHRQLADRDPVMAARLTTGDTQRLTRALEVLDATGRSLAEWQSRPGVPVLRVEETERLVVLPSRVEVRARCASRFEAMLAAGAEAEVAAFMALGLDPALPAMRAHGVRPLAAMQAGRLSHGEAVDHAISETRQYARRQLTWIRRHMRSWSVHIEQ